MSRVSGRVARVAPGAADEGAKSAVSKLFEKTVCSKSMQCDFKKSSILFSSFLYVTCNKWSTIRTLLLLVVLLLC